MGDIEWIRAPAYNALGPPSLEILCYRSLVNHRNWLGKSGRISMIWFYHFGFEVRSPGYACAEVLFPWLRGPGRYTFGPSAWHLGSMLCGATDPY